MRKKLLIAVLLIAMIAVLLAGCSSEKGIENGGFETLTGAEGHKKAAGWEMQGAEEDSDSEFSFVNDNLVGSSEYIEEMGAKQLKVSVMLKASYAHLYQKVKLSKGQLYELSAYIKVDSRLSGAHSDSDFYGAYVGFLEDPNFDAIVVNEETEGWIKHTVYFKSTTSKTLTLVVGIGSPEKGRAKGNAYFDQIDLKAVDSVPADAKLYTLKEGSSYDLGDGGSAAYVIIGAIVTAALCFGLYLLLRRLFAKGENFTLGKNKFLSPTALFVYVLVGAFLIRFILAIIINGFGSNISELSKLAVNLSVFGPWEITSQSGMANAPVGVMYILWAIGGFANFAGISMGSVGMSIMIRLPMVLADLIVCYLIFSTINKNYGTYMASIFGGLYALLPMAFTASATWGMSVSIAMPFIVGLMITMLNKNIIGTSVMCALSVLFCTWTVLLVPFVVAFYVYNFVKNKPSRLTIGLSVLIGFVGFYLVTLPFTIGQLGDGNVFFIFERMLSEINAVGFYSKDAYSIFAIFGLVNRGINMPVEIISALLTIAIIGVGIYMILTANNRLETILICGATLLILSTFTVRANVVLPIIGTVLLLLYTGLSGERRMYAVTSGFSLATFLNIAILMSYSGYLSTSPSPNASYLPFYRFDAFMIIMSILQVALAIYMCKVVCDISFKNKMYEFQPLTGSYMAELKYNIKNLRKK